MTDEKCKKVSNTEAFLIIIKNIWYDIDNMKIKLSLFCMVKRD